MSNLFREFYYYKIVDDMILHTPCNLNVSDLRSAIYLFMHIR